MATSDDKKKKVVDEVTGIETTGHEWDGLTELNKPAPRWWLWVFYVTVIWAIGYSIYYPSWPTFDGEGPRGGNTGKLEWTQYKQLAEQQAEITARKGQYLDRFMDASLEQIAKDDELYRFAMAGGAAAFKDNCAACHGTGAAGGPGYPNLNDDDWLWDGSLQGIYDTIKHGVRSTPDETRFSLMTSFGKDGVLTREQIVTVSDYVLSLSGEGEATEEGAKIFAENCASCHGADGTGDQSQGAPDLTDAIWLFGGTRQDIINQVTNARNGVMPHWSDKLDDETIKQLSVYVHELGGGTK